MSSPSFFHSFFPKAWSLLFGLLKLFMHVQSFFSLGGNTFVAHGLVVQNVVIMILPWITQIMRFYLFNIWSFANISVVALFLIFFVQIMISHLCSMNKWNPEFWAPYLYHNLDWYCWMHTERLKKINKGISACLLFAKFLFGLK